MSVCMVYDNFRWESDKDFCKDVIMKEPYNSGSMLMDLVDATIVDYLIGNADRHHYETLGTQSDSMVLILDNGKRYLRIVFMQLLL